MVSCEGDAFHNRDAILTLRGWSAEVRVRIPLRGGIHLAFDPGSLGHVTNQSGSPESRVRILPESEKDVERIRSATGRAERTIF